MENVLSYSTRFFVRLECLTLRIGLCLFIKGGTMLSQLI